MGKSNLNLCIIPQLIAQGVHVDIFDVTEDYRDILQVPSCGNGLVLKPEEDRFNPLEPIGDPYQHLHFLYEWMAQDFNLRPETREMLFNFTIRLYDQFGVSDGEVPPSMNDLIQYLTKEKKRPGTTNTTKNKIDSALRTLTYLTNTFPSMANCRRGHPIDTLDRFSFISNEIGNLSEELRSWYTKIKLRQYHHKGQSAATRHKLFRVIVVDEAKGIFGKSRIGLSTNYIKDMYTRSRSIGCWWIVSDQFPSDIADFVRAASVQISFQHTVPKEIREISAGMGCTEAQKSEIPRLGRYRALQKITDFPSPYVIMTHKSQVKRHIGDAELQSLMANRLAQLSTKSGGYPNSKRVRVISTSVIRPENHQETPTYEVLADKSVLPANPLEDFNLFLRFVHENPGTNLTSLYRALNLSGRKGDALKNKLVKSGLLEQNTVRKGGKGRPSKELQLTDKGRRYLDEK
jgi:predicted transcriptional regulator